MLANNLAFGILVREASQRRARQEIENTTGVVWLVGGGERIMFSWKVYVIILSSHYLFEAAPHHIPIYTAPVWLIECCVGKDSR